MSGIQIVLFPTSASEAGETKHMRIQSLQPSFNDYSYLDIVANKEGRVTLKVVSANGMMAKTVTTTISSGNQKLALDLNDLNSGVYVLNAFNDGEFVKSIRFIKQ
jgi:hypothetical protein